MSALPYVFTQTVNNRIGDGGNMVMYPAVIAQYPLENIAGFRPGIFILPQLFKMLAAGRGLQLADHLFAVHQLMRGIQIFPQKGGDRQTQAGEHFPVQQAMWCSSNG